MVTGAGVRGQGLETRASEQLLASSGWLSVSNWGPEASEIQVNSEQKRGMKRAKSAADLFSDHGQLINQPLVSSPCFT